MIELLFCLAFGYFCSMLFSFLDAFTFRIEEAFFLKNRKQILSKWKHLFGGRSHCDCKEQNTLQWYLLVPIWSFLFQRAKCIFCKERLSPRYFIGEFLSLLFGTSICYIYGLNLFLFFIVAYAFLGYIICVLDYKYLIIPWEYLYCFIFIAILNIFFISQTGIFYFLEISIPFWICQILLAFFWMLLFWSIYILFPNKLGFSDVLLIFVLSLGLPFPSAIYLPSLGSIIGLAFVGLKILMQFKQKSSISNKLKTQKVPFGMYLVLAFGILLLTSNQ